MTASGILAAVDHPSAALLVYALHLAWSGGTAANVATLPRAWLHHAQLCDAASSGADPDDPEAVLKEAVHRWLRIGIGRVARGFSCDEADAVRYTDHAR